MQILNKQNAKMLQNPQYVVCLNLLVAHKASKLIKLIRFSPTHDLSDRMDCVRRENGENELKGHCIFY